MKYRLEIEARAAKSLLGLPKAAVLNLTETIAALVDDPRPPGARKLTGREGYRVRAGDYRVLYEVEDTIRRVRIYKIGHRKDVYR